MNTTTTLIVSVIIALLIGAFAGYYLAPTATIGKSGGAVMLDANSDKQLALYGAMRTLWAEHVIWTRGYIVSAVENRPDTSQVAARLMKNQEDIGAAIAVYYGKAAGDSLTVLLKEHISIAVEIVTAAKAGEQAKFQSANQRWQANADQIATFLSQANPNLPKAAVADLMREHLETTADVLTARLDKQYAKDIAASDAVFAHIMKMADALSAGIIKQFPEKFGISTSTSAANTSGGNTLSGTAY